MSNILKIKRGLNEPIDGTLQDGELGFVKNTNMLYIGKNDENGKNIVQSIHVDGKDINNVVPLSKGGTGAKDAASARNNLGLGNVNNTSDSSKNVSSAGVIRDRQTGKGIYAQYYQDYVNPTYLAGFQNMNGNAVVGSITPDSAKSLLDLKTEKLTVGSASSSFTGENIDVHVIKGLGIAFIRGFAKTSTTLTSGSIYTVGKINNSSLMPTYKTALSKFTSRNISLRIDSDGSIILQAFESIPANHVFYFSGMYTI